MGYNQMALYVDFEINDDAIRKFKKSIKDETDPDEIKKKIEQLMVDKFVKDTGSDDQLKTREKNFKKFLESEVLTKKRKVFKYKGESTAFDDLKEQYYNAEGILVTPKTQYSKKTRKVLGSEVKGIPTVTQMKDDINRAIVEQRMSPVDNLDEKNKKELIGLWKEIIPERKSKYAYMRKQKGIINFNDKAGLKGLPDLYQLRDYYRRQVYLPGEQQPVSAKDLKELYEIADQKIQKYEGQLKKTPRSKEQLTRLLVEAGVGTKGELDDLDTKQLKENWKRFKKGIKTPKESFITTFDDLPDKRETLKRWLSRKGEATDKDIFKRAKKTIEKRHTPERYGLLESPDEFLSKAFKAVEEPLKDPQLETDRRKKREIEYLTAPSSRKKFSPVLTEQEMDKETNEWVAASKSEVPVAERELERLFAKKKYKNPDKILSFDDRLELVKTKKSKLKDWIKDEYKDKPFSLPADSIEFYKKEHGQKLKREKEIFDYQKRREKQRLTQLIEGKGLTKPKTEGKKPRAVKKAGAPDVTKELEKEIGVPIPKELREEFTIGDYDDLVSS